jgi:tetratricopeptide (TPR) repeat protein
LALQAKGDVAGAIECYRRAIAADPRYAQAHSNLGNALQAKGDVAGAIECYRRAIAADPKHAKAHTNLGLALKEKGELGEAIECYRNAIAADPKHAKAHFNLGLVLKKKGDVAGAIACFKSAIAADPKNAPAHNNLGAALQDKGELGEAMACYRRAIAADPKHAKAHSNLGLALQAKGDVAGAIECYRRAIAADPKFAKAHFNLGATLHVKGEVEGAMAYYRRAVAADPRYAPAHANLGAALLQQGKFAQALEATGRCLELLPADHPSRMLAAAQRQRCRQLLSLDERLAAVVAGKAHAGGAAERLALAWLCQQPYKGLYAASARLCAEAFAQRPVLADDLAAAPRYNAACAAALAGCGKGKDGGTLDELARSRLRAQALTWLRADLAAHAALADKTAPEARQDLQRTLSHWRKDPDLAGLRGEALDALPAAERADWSRLWAEVDALLARVRPQP